MKTTKAKMAVVLVFFALVGVKITAQKIDIDLTRMNPTFVYAQVFNFLSEPEQYEGKMVRMRGGLYVFSGEDTENQQYACVIQDALACCAQGLQFEPSKNQKFPSDFQNGTTITVTGKLHQYEENGFSRVAIVDAVIE